MSHQSENGNPETQKVALQPIPFFLTLYESEVLGFFHLCESNALVFIYKCQIRAVFALFMSSFLASEDFGFFFVSQKEN